MSTRCNWIIIIAILRVGRTARVIVIAFGTQSHAVRNFSHRRYHSLPTTRQTRIKTIRFQLESSPGIFCKTPSGCVCVFFHSFTVRLSSFCYETFKNYSKTLQIQWDIWHRVLSVMQKRMLMLESRTRARESGWSENERAKAAKTNENEKQQQQRNIHWKWHTIFILIQQTSHLTRWKDCHFYLWSFSF